MSWLLSIWDWIFGGDDNATTTTTRNTDKKEEQESTGVAKMSGSVEDIKSADELLKLANEAKGSLVVIHFWADWAPQCKQVDDVVAELAKRTPNARFGRVEAEAVVELSEKFTVTAVPTIILLKGGNVVDRVDGANVPELASKVEKHATAPAAPAASGQQSSVCDLDAKLRKLIHAAPVMLFMKGTPDEPRCGFSRTMVELLKSQDAEYSSFNILADPEVRQGLKTFSNWPTYPQLYIDGELVGGLDIIKWPHNHHPCPHHHQSPPSRRPCACACRLKKLTHQSPVMLFMKGTPDAPRCGFSRTMAQLLRDQDIAFDYYDILGDEEVRQGLKTFSNWPTYPQLYSKGNLIGGLDIVKELIEMDSLKDELNQ
ncbi:PKCq-interacting protein PICOT [Salpingoeca rosetta]|uniref:PKCq-interacting protein PICOT n=1 Tax=Salpingoeca rosetta (strain ATCC 50818 / BSB-021) TaxID=946362 RepID=F2U6Z5_SALR5|nr:PKCq-interacting protein PICOT [Salpingoeca rosetta]EGD83627.1 PKCq-interacting protein PICOT [Salpingoeca rosetta]|eukprot:XP_004995131.1 PKCq-interacting protein PICOT [Salpingoeca rosetta]